MSSQHTNYLRSNRKRLDFSQEEVAFLLGFTGEDKGIKVCRNESSARVPNLHVALAYEAIYGRPVRELFSGLYQQIEKMVAERVRILSRRTKWKQSPERRQTLASLITRLTASLSA